MRKLEEAEDKEEAFRESLLDDEIEGENAEKCVNKFYSPQLLNYLLVTVLPYAPLLDHSLLLLNEYGSSILTNNPVEAWNYIVKRVEFFNALPMSAARFVRAEAQVVLGKK